MLENSAMNNMQNKVFSENQLILFLEKDLSKETSCNFLLFLSCYHFTRVRTPAKTEQYMTLHVKGLLIAKD